MTIKALVFDFDGTMVDTETLDYRCWQDVYREHGCELDIAVWSQCVGTVTDAFHPVTHLEKLVARELNRPELTTQHEERVRREADNLPILAGVKDWIREAEELGLKIGVASSSKREWVHGHLGRRDLLQHLKAVRCAEDVERVKPDPQLYLEVVNALGVLPGEAIAIEDSPNGLRAAKAAGLRTVSVPNSITCRMPAEPADVRLRSLEDASLSEVIGVLDEVALA